MLRHDLDRFLFEPDDLVVVVGQDGLVANVAKYLDGLTVAELGSQAGKSEKAAESTLHRARLAFSRVFQLLAKKRGELE